MNRCKGPIRISSMSKNERTLCLSEPRLQDGISVTVTSKCFFALLSETEVPCQLSRRESSFAKPNHKRWKQRRIVFAQRRGRSRAYPESCDSMPMPSRFASLALVHLTKKNYFSPNAICAGLLWSSFSLAIVARLILQIYLLGAVVTPVRGVRVRPDLHVYA